MHKAHTYNLNVENSPDLTGLSFWNRGSLQWAPVGQPLLPADREWLVAFRNYLRKHLSNNILTIPFLAREFTMSESTLLRRIKRLTGLTPQQYLQEIRLEKARRLLKTRECSSVRQVASRVGYRNARSFSRSFRAHFGWLPSEELEGRLEGYSAPLS